MQSIGSIIIKVMTKCLGIN